MPDAPRAPWFADDDAQRMQEDWNLLYVAATRARQVLIVSGTAPARGEFENTWYTTLKGAESASDGAAPAERIEASPMTRRVFDFLPEPLPTGQRPVAETVTEVMRLGLAWHALLELGDAADVDTVVRAHGLTADQAALVSAAARRVRAAWPQFFEGAGDPEVELVAENGDLLRIDRLVELDDALWILDFKWRLTSEERPRYEAQVRRYAEVLRTIRGNRPVRMGLLSAEAELTEIPH
jgi:ATP-dependent helicase/nuclease subunit A